MCLKKKLYNVYNVYNFYIICILLIYVKIIIVTIKKLKITKENVSTKDMFNGFIRKQFHILN